MMLDNVHNIHAYTMYVHTVHVLTQVFCYCSLPSPPLSLSVDPSLFPPQEVIKKPVETEPSLLSVLLAAYDKKSANPFFEYSKFNGEVCSPHATTRQSSHLLLYPWLWLYTCTSLWIEWPIFAIFQQPVFQISTAWSVVSTCSYKIL